MDRFWRSSAPRLLYYSVCSTSPPSPSSSLLRHFSAAGNLAFAKDSKEPWWKESVERLRNIWISGLIDPNKMELTERVLFYGGRMHELRRRDEVPQIIDWMGLGKTIHSAATYCTWKDYQINIIDTPVHVDFTIEVEKALRILDGAILVLCSVGGVQNQSITVDRQMRRYEVPRLAFINKLDQMGANPWKVLNQARSNLRHHSAAVQVPIGLEDDFNGLVDLVQLKSYYFQGSNGPVSVSWFKPVIKSPWHYSLDYSIVGYCSETTVAEEVPADMEALVSEKRRELIKAVSEVDNKLAEAFCIDKPISAVDLESLQPLLDGVISYLPCPIEVSNYALDQTMNEKVELSGSPDGPFVALAFILEDKLFGQLTYLRIYEGVIRKGDFIINSHTGKKIKVPRLVRTHSNEMEDVQEAHAGQIVAVFGVDCASGDTFTDGSIRYTMTSMKVPEPLSKDS